MSALIVVLAAVLGSVDASAGAAEGPIAIDPGTIVRWPGEEVESCGMGNRKWSALPDGCWYAIDLLTEPGPVRLVRRRRGILEETAIRVTDYPYQVQRITLKDDSQVNLSAQDLARVRQENQRIARLWSLDTSRAFALPLEAPLDPLPDGGRFGQRRFFNDQPRSPHSGADYAAATGTPVGAVAAGRVALTGDFFFSGRSVFIDHGGGLVSMYFHLSEITVAEGDEVTPEERIGAVGQSGRATGPHLHFGIRWYGARVDPGLLIRTTQGVKSLP